MFMFWSSCSLFWSRSCYRVGLSKTRCGYVRVRSAPPSLAPQGFGKLPPDWRPHFCDQLRKVSEGPSRSNARTFQLAPNKKAGHLGLLFCLLEERNLYQISLAARAIMASLLQRMPSAKDTVFGSRRSK